MFQLLRMMEYCSEAERSLYFDARSGRWDVEQLLEDLNDPRALRAHNCSVEVYDGQHAPTAQNIDIAGVVALLANILLS